MPDTSLIQTAQKILEFKAKKFVFVSISGAHLYGFDSYNSDLDLRACHFPEKFEILRYFNSSDTFEKMYLKPELWDDEVDIVSHSLLKYLYLLTRQPNGYILEQLFSPLVVFTSSLHQELKELAKFTFSKELKYHYGGFLKNQEKLLSKEKKEIKLVLYQLRIICSSINFARNCEIDANLLSANQKTNIFDQAKIDELIEIKKMGEKNSFTNESLKKYWLKEIQDKFNLIDVEFEKSNLRNFDSNFANKKAQEFIQKNWDLIVS
jgi:predicted nucleotidyltransferase